MHERVTRVISIEAALAVRAEKRGANATLKSDLGLTPRWEARSPLGYAIFREEQSRIRG